MVGIPVFVDQKMNMAIGAANGYAVVVDYRNITEENLSIALKEVLNDPKQVPFVVYRAPRNVVASFSISPTR
jgi:UDP:flavonoid glycosyltransferase YjiC (YdhE family)